MRRDRVSEREREREGERWTDRHTEKENILFFAPNAVSGQCLNPHGSF